MGSTNGTWVNGRAIEHEPISTGSVVRVGDWVAVVAGWSGDVGFSEWAPGVFGGPEVKELLDSLRRVASSTVPVAIVGQTGTGKERFARAVHHFSGRAGAFLPVNCASLPDELAEAELFGYRRGAFTGAERGNLGHFRSAHGGTLFLDEMPELSPRIQAKLLRVIEDGQVLGLGESVTSSVNVRVVSASQQSMASLVNGRQLRQDLAARLTGLELHLPPLAARRCDIIPLFRLFLDQETGGRPLHVDARVIEGLCAYDWPQNVRELELVTRTLIAVHGHEPILKPRHLPPKLTEKIKNQPKSPAPSSSALRPRRDHDLERLEAELQRNGGNVQGAARALGISRQRIYRLLDARAASGTNEQQSAGDGKRDVAD